MASVTKPSKQDLVKDDNRTGKSVGRSSGSLTNDRDTSHSSDARPSVAANVSSVVSANGNTVSASAKSSAPSTRTSDTHGSDSKLENAAAKSTDSRKEDGAEGLDAPRHSSRPMHSPRHENASTSSKSIDKLQKRASPAEETDRLSKRRKGDTDVRDLEGDGRFSDRERSVDARFGDLDKSGTDEQSVYRTADKLSDRSKEKASERHEKDYRERPERPDKSRGDELSEKTRDRSVERYGRERSVEWGSDRNFDRIPEKGKDDRSKVRYNDTTAEKSHGDDRFHGQTLPPPPPIPPHVTPQSINTGRRDEDVDRRFGTTRHTQRLSPRHEEKERRRSEESLVVQDETKRRREDDFRERKREDREGLSMKVCVRYQYVASYS